MRETADYGFDGCLHGAAGWHPIPAASFWGTWSPGSSLDFDLCPHWQRSEECRGTSSTVPAQKCHWTLEVAEHRAHTDAPGSERIPEGGAYAVYACTAILRTDGRGSTGRGPGRPS